MSPNASFSARHVSCRAQEYLWLGRKAPRGANRITAFAARRLTASLLAFAAMLVCIIDPAAAAPACRPGLAVTQAKLSEVQASLERRWTAVVTVDASRCASTAGYFTVGFLRDKENAMPLEFRKEFIWSAPSVLIGVDVWADEAIEISWIDSVQGCPCAR